MIIINKTKGKILAKKAKLCKSHISKAIGLMFSRKAKPLMFIFDKEEIVQLHMFFVFFPIDIIYIDSNNQVVEIKENFRPFAFYNPKNKAKYVIELPKGTIKKTNTQIEDTIRFK